MEKPAKFQHEKMITRPNFRKRIAPRGNRTPGTASPLMKWQSCILPLNHWRLATAVPLLLYYLLNFRCVYSGYSFALYLSQPIMQTIETRSTQIAVLWMSVYVPGSG